MWLTLVLALALADPEVSMPPVIAVDADAVIVVPPTQRLSAAQEASAFLGRVRDRLDEQLIDYPSARFTAARLGRRGASHVACGKVNSKNRMGGYTGWSLFVAIEQRGHVTLVLPEDEATSEFGSFDQVVQDYCLNSAIVWQPGDASDRLAFAGPAAP